MLDCPGCKAGKIHDADTFQAHVLGLAAAAGASATLTQKLAAFATSAAAGTGGLMQRLLAFLQAEGPTIITELPAVISFFQGLFATTVQPTPAPTPAPAPSPPPAPNPVPAPVASK